MPQRNRSRFWNTTGTFSLRRGHIRFSGVMSAITPLSSLNENSNANAMLGMKGNPILDILLRLSNLCGACQAFFIFFDLGTLKQTADPALLFTREKACGPP
jgi:hypothetical protein